MYKCTVYAYNLVSGFYCHDIGHKFPVMFVPWWLGLVSLLCTCICMIIITYCTHALYIHGVIMDTTLAIVSQCKCTHMS